MGRKMLQIFEEKSLAVRILERLTAFLLPLLIGIAAGYAWAVSAYEVLA